MIPSNGSMSVRKRFNRLKDKVCGLLMEITGVRHAVLIISFAALSVLIIATIGLTSGDGGLPKITRMQPVFSSRSSVQSLPEAKTSETPASAGRIIAIDPGHGGIDPGTFYEDVREDEINYSIALLVREYLENLGYRVILTRDDGETMSIEDRVKIAGDNNADILVSIHQNALENDTVTNGIETWYNKSKNKLSKRLAKYIQENTVAATGARDRGLRPDKKLIITRKADMPSCLSETGFITSTAERANLVSEDYQKKIASGIVAGIEEFFRSLDPEG